jgi:signal transduction histidine kinase
MKNIVGIIKLENSNMSDAMMEHFRALDRAIQRMTHQIDDVLDFVKPKSLILQKQSLLPLLISVRKKIRIPDSVILTLPTNNVDMFCDAEKLEVVFINLITNAIQSMNNKGTVSIRGSEQKDDVIIEVEDTGSGIPDNVLPKIFDPLFTTRQIGTGLGLPSCKTIVERHGGTIDVKTDLGKGTTFIIKLPRAPSPRSDLPHTS